MRFTVLFITALVLTACGDSAPDPTVASLPGNRSERAAAAGSTPPETDNDTLAMIRADYQRIEAARRSGILMEDSLSYRCEDYPVEGIVHFYSEGADVVLLTHGYSRGDHEGTTERYYYRNGQLFFHLQESGYWEFGGAMQTMPDGAEVPGSIDHVTEERRYYAAGKLIKALTKSYSFDSAEDRSTKAAAAANGPLLATGLPAGEAFLKAVRATRKADCKAVGRLIGS